MSSHSVTNSPNCNFVCGFEFKFAYDFWQSVLFKSATHVKLTWLIIRCSDRIQLYQKPHQLPRVLIKHSALMINRNQLCVFIQLCVRTRTYRRTTVLLSHLPRITEFASRKFIAWIKHTLRRVFIRLWLTLFPLVLFQKKGDLWVVLPNTLLPTTSFHRNLNLIKLNWSFLTKLPLWYWYLFSQKYRLFNKRLSLI